MGLTGVVAKSCTLLDGESEVGANHSLEVAEAADDRAIVPRVGVGGCVGMGVKWVGGVSGRVMKFDAGGAGRVEADHAEDAVNHVRLREGDGAVGVAREVGAEIVLEGTVGGEVEVILEGCDFRGDERGVGTEEAGIVDVKDKGNVGFSVEASVDGGGRPAPID